MGGIAERISKNYGNFKCLEFARALATKLKKDGHKYDMVMLAGDGSCDNIIINECRTLNGEVLKDGDVISRSGKHIGILYNGKVYDNIYWEGILLDEWKRKYSCQGLQFYEIQYFRDFTYFSRSQK